MFKFVEELQHKEIRFKKSVYRLNSSGKAENKIQKIKHVQHIKRRQCYNNTLQLK